MRPPYAVVKAQLQNGHRELKIASAKLSDDARTLSVKLAEPMPWRSWYALAIPGVKAPGAPGLGTIVDVDFPLQGVVAHLNVHNAGAPRYADDPWMPHLSTDVSADLTRGSSQHDQLASQLFGPHLLVNLEINGKLDLPGNTATLTFASNRPFEAQAQPAGGVVNVKADSKTGDAYTGTLQVATGGALLPIHLNLDLTRAADPPQLSITYTTDQNHTSRPIPLDRILPRWAPAERQPVNMTPPPSPLTQGGDWNAGRTLFFGDAKCSTCHTVNGQGGNVGPNLSNLVHVNPESVMQDILEPSARINPDHVSYIVETKSGDTVSGLLRQEGDRLVVSEAADKTTTIARADVKEIRPSKISLMPEGYKQTLGEKGLRDVLTFLTEEKPKPK
jgi:putative heme-binding domain-containing protein